jgi:hypothetical protein
LAALERILNRYARHYLLAGCNPRK